jgi:hypothetical protein
MREPKNDAEKQAKITTRMLSKLPRRFNWAEPVPCQGNPRDDFWTLQDKVSRKETRPETSLRPPAVMSLPF